MATISWYMTHTATIKVIIRGVGKIDVFCRNEPLLTFVLRAYKRITGTAIEYADNKEEIQKWRVQRFYLFKDEGVLEVDRVEQFESQTVDSFEI